MLIDCICGESKFAINAEQIGFDGRLVRCGKCGKEWFQESKLNVIEKKLIDLDQSLHAKEIEVANEKNSYSDRISSLERELENKKKELESQKLLEQRLALFESRVRDNFSETSRQKSHEERINVLKKELEKKTLDLFIKNTALEKRSVTLQNQLSDKSLDERLSSLEKTLVRKKIGGRVINTEKPIQVYESNSGDVEKDDEPAKAFEIDDIQLKKNNPEKDRNSEKASDSNGYTQIHEDEDDSARIGRSGDPLKRKKV